MKKILFASFFSAAAIMGLSSCMNGDYDANPATTNSGTNPLATGGSGSGSGGGSGPGTAAKGEIRFSLNGGTNVTYSGSGTHYTLVGTDPLISGGNTGSTGTTSVDLFILNYTGPGTYTISGTTSSSTHGDYNSTPFGSGADDYNTATGTPVGSGQIVVTSDANSEMKGTFSFTAYNSSGSKTEITNGSFDVTQ